MAPSDTAARSVGRKSPAEVIQFQRRPAPTPAPPTAACFNCRQRWTCLPAVVSDLALHDLDGAVLGHRRLRAGQSLYREGDRLQNVYSVRAGTFKLASALGDGREHVGRIALQGDVMGLDGLATGLYAVTATALEDGEACSISVATLHELASRRPEWHAALCRVMAEEIAREQRHLVVLGAGGTEARVADFLLDVSGRLRERGYSGSEFHLRLSRAEIGSYLGLTLETVSRTLSAFQQGGSIAVCKRHIRIVSREALQRAAGGAVIVPEVRRA